MKTVKATGGFSVREWAGRIRPLRVAMLGFTLLVMLLVPVPGTPAAAHGWAFVPTLLAPVLAPLILMVLLLDALMTRIFMTDATGAERARLKYIVAVDLVAAVALFLFWLPYFIAIGAKIS